MLELRRRPRESIKIGQEITLTVLGVKGRAVKLGINAPSDVEILREEILERRTLATLLGMLHDNTRS